MNETTIAVPDGPSGRRLFLGGLVLALLGIALYFVQLSVQRLFLPWYMPVMALLGVLLIGLSLARRRTSVRMIVLWAVAILGVLEVAALFAMRLPAYGGPLAVGGPFPEFESRRADASIFTKADLMGETHHVIVFFRGRW